jgi:diadenosine tetraphosphate (Ap4A) HIT family hydrolase
MSIDVPADNPPTLSPEELFCLEGCSTYTQYHHMRSNFEKGFCVFCNLDRQRNKVLWEDQHFMLWEVPAGMGKTRPLAHHILIVPKRHRRFVANLTTREAVSMVRANKFARETLGYTGGLNHAREGDMRNNAGTVPHLHFNLFQPSGEKPVEVSVFKNPEKRQANQERAAGFAEHYNQGVSPERFDELVSAGTMSPDGYQASQI